MSRPIHGPFKAVGSQFHCRAAFSAAQFPWENAFAVLYTPRVMGHPLTRRSKIAKMVQRLVWAGFAGVLCVSSALAQAAIWRIDSVHSTARLYVASTNRQGARINLGVARVGGEVLQTTDSQLPRTFTFQIYPADRNARASQPPERGGTPQALGWATTTSISFHSKTVELLDAKSVLVTGDLTVTYVSRAAEFDPSKGYSGPTFGPPLTHTAKHEARFVFHVLSSGLPEGKQGSPVWSATSVVAGDAFPELWNSVVTTDWPAFVVNEQCNMPSGVGEDFSGPACKGKVVEPFPRTDAQCTTPSQVGEDFTDAVCSGTPLPAIPKREGVGHANQASANGNSGQAMANEVVIELVVRLTKKDAAPEKPPATTGHPTAENCKAVEVAAVHVRELRPNQ